MSRSLAASTAEASIGTARSGTSTSTAWRARALTSQGWPRVSAKARELASGVKNLAGVGRVLAVELGDLVCGKVGKGERLDLDVERRGGAQALNVGSHLQSVVAHVPQADEGHGLGEGARPVGIAGPKLAEDRDQDVVHERVDLVQEENYRQRALPGPASQKIEQARLGRSVGVGIRRKE